MKTALSLFLAATIACSATAASAQAPDVHLSVVSDYKMRITTTIQDIDLDKRLLTLKGSKGDITELAVSDKVNNFDKLKKGETLTGRYHETVSIGVIRGKAASPGSEEQWNLESTKPGDEPGVVASTHITVIASVVSVDPHKPSVTLMIPDSGAKEIVVNDPSVVRDVKAGDLMEMVTTKVMVFAADGKGVR